MDVNTFYWFTFPPNFVFAKISSSKRGYLRLPGSNKLRITHKQFSMWLLRHFLSMSPLNYSLVRACFHTIPAVLAINASCTSKLLNQ
ncbi:hypothetical protein L596_013422 [Steinernema carpocapsae]|uniref:Uncharacterized protein n=1 Tax=Steinernema carpocapsae TaxID=34508 RepID=A0A4U5P037_STECR|nr:hypothetical protein L596_013422 [Steinernema carpocapsae]